MVAKFKKECVMKFLLSLALLIPMAAVAQDMESDGPAGTNSIHPIHNGCALQENWQGAGEGGSWTVLFDGLYSKAPANP